MISVYGEIEYGLLNSVTVIVVGEFEEPRFRLSLMCELAIACQTFETWLNFLEFHLKRRICVRNLRWSIDQCFFCVDLVLFFGLLFRA